MIVDPEPLQQGLIDRGDAEIHYQVFGDGDRAVVLLPTWSIVHSDHWRWQAPHLAERYRVVVFDGRGNGASSRPETAEAYADALFAADALAVMDQVEVERAALLSVSAGACWELILAATERERVTAAVFIGASLPLGQPLPDRAATMAHFDEPQAAYEGWQKFNRHYWQADWPGFLRFFFSQCFTEPGSDAEIEHFVQMGLDTTPETILLTVDAPGLGRSEAEALARAVSSPTLVMHGTGDAISSPSRGVELAQLTAGELALMPRVGHEPQCRWPQDVNTMIDQFLERHWAAT
ncbi:MAG TPA: alpha/beta hydrolase [Gemmatimonadaceae bacterium]|nr:alpha/beta hydrolase [Gemmatimonadaceae bacterium]